MRMQKGPNKKFDIVKVRDSDYFRKRMSTVGMQQTIKYSFKGAFKLFFNSLVKQQIKLLRYISFDQLKCRPQIMTTFAALNCISSGFQFCVDKQRISGVSATCMIFTFMDVQYSMPKISTHNFFGSLSLEPISQHPSLPQIEQ